MKLKDEKGRYICETCGQRCPKPHLDKWGRCPECAIEEEMEFNDEADEYEKLCPEPEF